ncbi:MAG: hypothetical protein H6832_19080 [Planctomycetes bacterium]|nr:hypothetical protein [Planctomycetota bacterium]
MLSRTPLTLGVALLTLCIPGATIQRAPGVAVEFAAPRVTSGEDFDVEPDPPTTDQDLEISYSGLETEIDYQVEGEGPVRVDVSEDGAFKIPKEKLTGKKFIRIVARGGGEAGYLVIYFKK